METDIMKDFVVDTEGQCFLCLKQIITTSSSSLKCSVYNVQDLSQYLRINRGKVFHEKVTIPQELLDKVENARLKVELCKNCGGLAEQFSKLFRQLEKVEMEIGDCLNHIHGRMEIGKTAEVGSRIQGNSTGGLRLKQEIVEVLRSEVMEKCSSKLATRQPRVKIDNLPIRKVNATILKMKRESSNRLADWNDYHHDDTDEMDFHNAEDYSKQQQPDTFSTSDEYFSSETKAQKPAKINTPAPITVINNLQISKGIVSRPQSTVNPETGNHKCSLCEKEFTLLKNFRVHYKSFHLKERYNCDVCGKQFLYKPGWYRHHKSAHLGIRFKCNGCDKLFTAKRYLLKHLKQNPTCRKGMPSNDGAEETSTEENATIQTQNPLDIVKNGN